MAIDAAKLLKGVKAKGERARATTTMYLDKALFKEFQERCDQAGFSASRVLEQFMREFLSSAASPATSAAAELSPIQRKILDTFAPIIDDEAEVLSHLAVVEVQLEHSPAAAVVGRTRKVRKKAE